MTVIQNVQVLSDAQSKVRLILTVCIHEKFAMPHKNANFKLRVRHIFGLVTYNWSLVLCKTECLLESHQHIPIDCDGTI